MSTTDEQEDVITDPQAPTRRVLVAVTVPADLDTRGVADWFTMLGSDVDATVWTPTEFAVTLADRDAQPEDQALLDVVATTFAAAASKTGDQPVHACERCPDRDPDYGSLALDDRDVAWAEHLSASNI